MARKSFTAWVLGVFCVAGLVGQADTFKHKETGEVFYGFRTTKTTAGKTLVYNETDKKMSPIDLNQYEIVLDEKGRRNSYVLVSITAPEALLSTNIAKAIADAITKAANTGPKFVMLKIDNPGGRGDNMKEICSTISKINTCPVVAYISGGPFGGAHSAAAGIAIACDKIYISPTASMSAAGPFVSTGTNLSEENFLKTYSPDSLASYSVYLSTVAETKRRPSLLAKAFLDKKLALVEVTDVDGTASVVEKNLRQPTQTVTKTVCEGIDPDAASETEKIEPEVVHSRVLNLTPAEAQRMKLVDGIADSVQAVAAQMGAPDAAIAVAPGIDTMVRQFGAAKRSVGKSLARIGFLENRVATLEDQMNTLEEQLRTSPAKVSQTREKNNKSYTRSRNSLNNEYYYYYDEQSDPFYTTPSSDQGMEDEPMTATSRGRKAPSATRSNQGRVRESETFTTNEAPEAAMETKNELYIVLDELVGEYQRTIASARRWGGVLPPELTIQSLQNNLDSAIALSDSLDYR